MTTREQIAEEIVNYFKAQTRGVDSQADTVIVSWENSACIIKAEAMYELHGLSFQDMKWVSDILKTEKINVRDEGYEGGCESCDYGSSAWWELECLEVGV